MLICIYQCDIVMLLARFAWSVRAPGANGEQWSAPGGGDNRPVALPSKAPARLIPITHLVDSGLMVQSSGAWASGKYLPEDALTGALFSLIRAFPFKVSLRGLVEVGLGLEGSTYTARTTAVRLWPPMFTRTRQLVIPDAVIELDNAVIVVEAKLHANFDDQQLRREEQLAAEIAAAGKTRLLLGISDHPDRPSEFRVTGGARSFPAKGKPVQLAQGKAFKVKVAWVYMSDLVTAQDINRTIVSPLRKQLSRRIV